MEQSLSDLLSDALSETSVPVFLDGDFDFENFSFDEKLEEDNEDVAHENVLTKENRVLYQEETGEATAVSGMETENLYTAENADKEEPDDNNDREDFQGDCVSFDSMNRTTEEDGDSEQEGFACGEDEEGHDEDMKHGEKQKDALAQRFDIGIPYSGGSAISDSDFPEASMQNLQNLIGDKGEHEEKIKDFSGEEYEEAGESFADYSSDSSSCEFLEDGVENQGSNSPSITLLHTSALTANQIVSLGGATADISWIGTEEGSDEQGEGYVYSRDLETTADKFGLLDVTEGKIDRGTTEIIENVLGYAAVTGGDDGDETSESDSYSSSDDDHDVQWRRGTDDELYVENIGPQDTENVMNPRDTWLYGASSGAFPAWSISDDNRISNNEADPADFGRSWDFDTSKTASGLSEDLLTADDKDNMEVLVSDVSQPPSQDINSYSVVQRDESKPTSPSYQGSVDDSFFFDTEFEASGLTELGQLGDDEYEEQRSWGQEQERINAFYKFYNDSEGDSEKEERQIKVQFCTEPLSQVIHYETDSSDGESFSSSTDREEEEEDDFGFAETFDVMELRKSDNPLQTTHSCDPTNAQVPESVPEKDESNTQICTRKHKCFCMLKMILKMGLLIGMGLLMYWLATDQLDWLSQVSFFER